MACTKYTDFKHFQDVFTKLSVRVLFTRNEALTYQQIILFNEP
jgi:hypothetical protein